MAIARRRIHQYNETDCPLLRGKTQRRLEPLTCVNAGVFCTVSLVMMLHLAHCIGHLRRFAVLTVLSAFGSVLPDMASGEPPQIPDPLATREQPQYIFVNRAPGGAADRWNQAMPERFTPESVRAIVDTIGARGTPRLRVGVGFMFSILEGDLKTTAESLRRLLEAAQAADCPVLVGLDGENWWETRPDLWNWWDPSLPGYDDANEGTSSGRAGVRNLPSR